MRLRKNSNSLLLFAGIAGGFYFLKRWFDTRTVNAATDNLKPQGQADTNFAYRDAGGYKSKSQFFGFINLASSEFKVPASIIEGVLWVESADGNNTTGATSGEVGIMQIIPSTVLYIRSLSPTLASAQPHIPSNAIRMGTALLADNYKKLHSWSKAIIAYNAGANSPRVKVSNDWYLVRVQERIKALYAAS